MEEFIELTIYGTNNKILIKKSEIKTVYMSDGKAAITSIIVGNREFDVNESYKKVKGMLVPPDSIQLKYTVEDKKEIEKFLEEWNNIGCTTFSSLGMTDDDWNRVITEFKQGY